MTEKHNRRQFLGTAGIGTLGFWLGGGLVQLTPAQARERDVPLRVLERQQAAALEAFADTLLPGSAAAGVTHFIDHQLAAPARDQLLMIRYLGVKSPFTPFYAGCAASLDASAQQLHQQNFDQLSQAHRHSLTAAIAQANPAGWDGAPAPLAYFVLRSDALDVVYGTKKGVESLGLPYMAHIEPPSRWGEPT